MVSLRDESRVVKKAADDTGLEFRKAGSLDITDLGVKPPGDGGAMNVQGRHHLRRVWMRAGDERVGREREEGRAEGEPSRAKERGPGHIRRREQRGHGRGE